MPTSIRQHVLACTWACICLSTTDMLMMMLLVSRDAVVRLTSVLCISVLSSCLADLCACSCRPCTMQHWRTTAVSKPHVWLPWRVPPRMPQRCLASSLSVTTGKSIRMQTTSHFQHILCSWPVLRVDVYIYLNMYMPAWPCPPSLLTWLREAAFPDASLVCCRSRQASITTELIEIISGAAALEG